MIIGIIAIDKNYAIGKDGKLPWHYSSDLKFFKKTTTGNAVIMGANTWRSIGRPLPNRLNVVLSRSGNVDVSDEVRVFGNKDEVTKLAETFVGDIFIIGGAKIYQSFADVIEKWIVTEIPLTVENADTFMPEDFLDGFECREVIELEGDLKAKIFRRKSKTVYDGGTKVS